jgi:hypothetical protein
LRTDIEPEEQFEIIAAYHGHDGQIAGWSSAPAPMGRRSKNLDLDHMNAALDKPVLHETDLPV